jgi:tetratricopeptide (TPR) repeat protein
MKLSVALLLVLAGVVCAQTGPRSGTGADRQGSIRGNVVMPNGAPVSGAVKVSLKVMRGDLSVAYTDEQGRFEIGNLAPGQYTIEVESDRDRRFELTSETVQVPRGGPALVTIYLKAKRTETQTTTEKTISVAMLDQKVPSAAKREFDKASRLAREGRNDESIESLRRAIAIYPDYLMAHNDLGAQLLEQEQFEEAAIELRAAIKIDPNAFNPALNLGIVLLRQNKYSEAIASLDKSLSIEPSSPSAHMFAGLASAKAGDTERGERELKVAYDLGGPPFAVALFHLGQLYMKKGERELALKAFESYLSETPNAANAAQVETLIARLRQH